MPLGLEARDNLARVHARLEDLQRHLAADRFLLLGHEDNAEAAFADLFQELVGPDDRAGAFRARFSDRGSQSRRGRCQKAVFAMGGEEELYPLACVLVVPNQHGKALLPPLRWNVGHQFDK